MATIDKVGDDVGSRGDFCTWNVKGINDQLNLRKPEETPG